MMNTNCEPMEQKPSSPRTKQREDSSVKAAPSQQSLFEPCSARKQPWILWWKKNKKKRQLSYSRIHDVKELKKKNEKRRLNNHGQVGICVFPQLDPMIFASHDKLIHARQRTRVLELKYPKHKHQQTLIVSSVFLNKHPYQRSSPTSASLMKSHVKMNLIASRHVLKSVLFLGAGVSSAGAAAAAMRVFRWGEIDCFYALFLHSFKKKPKLPLNGELVGYNFFANVILGVKLLLCLGGSRSSTNPLDVELLDEWIFVWRRGFQRCMINTIYTLHQLLCRFRSNRPGQGKRRCYRKIRKKNNHSSFSYRNWPPPLTHPEGHAMTSTKS